MAGQRPPDPGGYLETPAQFGLGIGTPHWKSYGGKDLYGDAALDKYAQYSDGTDAGYLDSLRKGGGDEKGQRDRGRLKPGA